MIGRQIEMNHCPLLHGPTIRIRLAVLFLCLLLQACSDRSDVTVGFLGPLEGKYSDLGVQGRNGVQLALEEANERGLVPGVRFRLLAEDDLNTPDGARQAVESLAAAKAVAIIGPMTSGVAEAALEQASIHRLPLISPTVSTPLLTGKRDLFFRVLSENSQWAKALARFGRERGGLRTIVIVADMDNEAFSGPYRDAFRSEFVRLGGMLLKDWEIRSLSLESWEPIVAEIERLAPDAVFVSLSSRDASRLAKTFASHSLKIPVYSTMWAATRELVVDCGQTCEGWIFGMGYSEDNARPEHLSFRDRYRQRFGYASNFAAALSYEATQIFIQGMLKADGDPKNLPLAMVALPELPGVIASFRLDEFGDVIRDHYIIQFTGRDFRTHETIR
jgi:branched-chain amino acid transport system substrate-binding protein